MTKFKSGMVTRNTLCLVKATFLGKVVKAKFLLLLVDRYLFNVVTDDRHIPRDSKETALSATITENVNINEWKISLGGSYAKCHLKI